MKSTQGKCQVTGDFGKLEKLVKELDAGYYVDVGIIGKNAAEDHGGLTLAAIGAAHEFGVKSRNIPERSFIRVPLKNHQAEIAEEAKAEAPALLEAGDVKGIFKTIGIACEQQIQAAFDTSGDGAWQGFSENYKIRPSGQPRTDESQLLVDTGALRKAVASRVGQK